MRRRWETHCQGELEDTGVGDGCLRTVMEAARAAAAQTDAARSFMVVFETVIEDRTSLYFDGWETTASGVRQA